MFSQHRYFKVLPEAATTENTTGLWEMLVTRIPDGGIARPIPDNIDTFSHHFTSFDEAIHFAYCFILSGFAHKFAFPEVEDIDLIKGLFDHTPAFESVVEDAQLGNKQDECLAKAIMTLITTHVLAGAETQQEITLAKVDAADRMMSFCDSEQRYVRMQIKPVVISASPPQSVTDALCIG